MKKIATLILVLTVSSLCWGGNDKPQCQKPQPTPPVVTPTDPTSVTVNSGSSSTSGASSTSQSGASATGGNATATGGNATGGNATGGNVSNSGNSSNTNTNTNTAQGGQGGQGGAGGNASQSQNQSSTSSASNNGSNVSVVNQAAKIPVATAYAPTALPSAPCVKGFGAGVQTMAVGGSFGGNKVDAGCDAREFAREFFLAGSRLAGCKMLVATKQAKKAGVTLEDCMASQDPPEKAEVVVPDPPKPVVEVQNNIPAPQILLIEQPVTVTPTREQLLEAGIVKTKPAVKHVATKKPCVIPESLKHDTMEK